jgi:hypothetical protein
MLARNGKPQFCIIAPTAYLNWYASQSDTHLVLAHLVDKDPVYADFYANEYGFKIMDNGAFELGESYAPDKLIDLGKKCKADAIVLPDYPGQPAQKTVDAAAQWIPAIKNSGFKTMFVPQSEHGDWKGWMEAYSWGSWNDDVDIIGMSILGIPTALPNISRSYARVVATALLQANNNFNFNKYHHYLGLNAGPALEIPSLINMDALDSCDSSNPVWMAILGHEYSRNTDSFLPVKKVKKEVDFSFPLIQDSETHRRIQNNISLTLDLFNEEFDV